VFGLCIYSNELDLVQAACSIIFLRQIYATITVNIMPQITQLKCYNLYKDFKIYLRLFKDFFLFQPALMNGDSTQTQKFFVQQVSSSSSSRTFPNSFVFGRHDTRHNDTHPNDTQLDCDTWYKDIDHNDSKQYKNTHIESN